MTESVPLRAIPAIRVVVAFALLLAVAPLLWSFDSAEADGETIQVLSTSVTSEFPEGIRFRAEVSGENAIESVAVRFRIGQQTVGAYDYLEFETGTLVELCTDDSHRLASTLPGTHIGLVLEEDLVEGLSDAASLIRDFYESNPRHATATFISGPSRTADIEMRLTLGVHGPASAHVVICSGWS